MLSQLSRLLRTPTRRRNTPLGRYQRTLEAQLASLTESVMQQWLSDIEGELRQNITDILDQSLKQSLTSLSRNSGQNGNREWSKSLENLVVNLAGELISPSKTTVSETETSRSNNAEQDFRRSRGQQATALARTIQRGQRNL